MPAATLQPCSLRNTPGAVRWRGFSPDNRWLEDENPFPRRTQVARIRSCYAEAPRRLRIRQVRAARADRVFGGAWARRRGGLHHV